MKFSYSKLNIFLTCPLQYKFKYIDKDKIEETTDNYSTYLGRGIHEALELLYQNKDKDLEWLEIHWLRICNQQIKIANKKSPEVFNNPNTKEIFKNHGRKILRIFYEANKDDFQNPKHETLALEQKFTTVFKEFTLSGVIDKVERIGSEIFVVDYKTGAPGAQKEIDENYQLSFYAIACRKTGLSLSNIHFCMHYVKNNIKIYTRRSIEDIKKLYSTLRTIELKIKNNEFEPTPSKGACKYCGFKKYCPAYKKEIEEVNESESS